MMSTPRAPAPHDMSETNRNNNRAVWFDIPVADLERSVAFYRAMLGVGVEIEGGGGFTFGVLEHDEGNGGCLVPDPDAVNRAGGVLIYLNVDGRIRDAVAKAKEHGGELLEEIQSIGPHGVRAVVRDSEGNRIALHSHTDG